MAAACQANPSVPKLAQATDTKINQLISDYRAKRGGADKPRIALDEGLLPTNS